MVYGVQGVFGLMNTLVWIIGITLIWIIGGTGITGVPPWILITGSQGYSVIRFPGSTISSGSPYPLVPYWFTTVPSGSPVLLFPLFPGSTISTVSIVPLFLGSTGDVIPIATKLSYVSFMSCDVDPLYYDLYLINNHYFLSYKVIISTYKFI